MIDLNTYRRNIYQRAGWRECPHYSEDGVILEIFRQIGVSKRPLAVEFGETRSLGTTTRSFRLKYLADAVYFTAGISMKSRILNVVDVFKYALEARQPRALRFFRTMPFDFFGTPDNIVDLLRKRGAGDIDILTIDIDSYDYFMAERILESGFAPRLMILEYNCNLPAGRRLAMAYQPGVPKPTNRRAFGASYEALMALASSYGYRLVHISGFLNLLFVRSEYAHLFATPDADAEIPRSNAAVMQFIVKYCQRGFVPSWFKDPLPSTADLVHFIDV